MNPQKINANSLAGMCLFLFFSFFTLISCSADADMMDIIAYEDEVNSVEIQESSDSEPDEKSSDEESSEESGTTEGDTPEEESSTSEEADPSEESAGESTGDTSETEDTGASDETSNDTTTDTSSQTSNSVQVDYYVTSNGSGSNSGKSESSAWSLQHALNNAQPGDNVYIKAGDYGSQEVSIYNSGTSSNPIKFIGYRETPGDINASNGSTIQYGDAINSSIMPMLSGNNGTSGMGIRLEGSYVEFHNLIIRKYKYGIISRGEGVVLNNVVTDMIGDYGSRSYSGVGMRVEGNNSKITNTFVLNAGAEGIVLNNCDNCEVLNTEVAADNNANATDYYILLTGGTENAVVDQCIVRRKTGLHHYGHGFVAKAGASYNRITNGKAINTTIEMSFSDVHDNIIRNIDVSGTFNQTGDLSGSVEVANGAHHNTFENITIDNVWGAIRFRDWQDGSGLPNDDNDAGNNNTFINVRVSNSLNGIHFDEFEKREGVAWNNSFIKCEFSNLNRLFQVNRPNSATTLRDCTIRDIPTFTSTSKGYDYHLNSNTVFENVSWINIGFKIP